MQGLKQPKEKGIKGLLSVTKVIVPINIKTEKTAVEKNTVNRV